MKYEAIQTQQGATSVGNTQTFIAYVEVRRVPWWKRALRAVGL